MAPGRKTNKDDSDNAVDFVEQYKKNIEQDEKNKQKKREDMKKRHNLRVKQLHDSIDAISYDNPTDLAPEITEFRNQRKIKLERLRGLIAEKNAIEAEIARHITEYENAYTTTCREVSAVLDARLKAANKD